MRAAGAASVRVSIDLLRSRSGDSQECAGQCHCGIKQGSHCATGKSADSGCTGQALDSAGRKKEARQDYEQCLRLDPKNGMALNNLAFLLVENHGDLDQALTFAQRARQALPHFTDVSDTLGQTYLRKQLTDSAVDTFKEIVAQQPARAIYGYHLGQAYAQKREKQKAIQELQTALKSNPQKDEETQIRQLLQKL